MTARATKPDLGGLRDQLSGRDLAIVEQVIELRLMTGAQIESVHFPVAEHQTADSAHRAVRRSLQRLVRLGLLTRLQRQIGGVRGGSAGFVYGPTSAAWRLVRNDGRRHRYVEPTATFVHHTLAISQLVVDLIDRHHGKQLELVRLESEPRCWRRYAGPGYTETLRPDLFVVLGVGDLELHWFVEIDLGTETLARRIVKCQQYERYYQSGEEQAKHDIFPRVVWLMPDQALATALGDNIDRSRSLTSALFEIGTRNRAIEVLTGGSR